MRAFIHDDGRGARLGSDDIAAVRYLYLPVDTRGVCRPSPTYLCLGHRFLVSLTWRNQYDGSSGVGRAMPRTDSTGFFSFGDPTNVELLVKVLDFGDVTKVFYGELTNLRFTLRVEDTQTGTVKTYGNSAGDCGGIDQSAFAGLTATGGGSASWTPGAAPATPVASSRAVPRSAGAGSCHPDRNTLCLLDGRFRVTVDWSNPANGQAGAAVAAPLSKMVGTFYFTDASNVELMTKLVPFPDRVAFFYGALSDLSYTIHVKDNLSGTEKSYSSTAGTLCGGLDNMAFPP